MVQHPTLGSNLPYADFGKDVLITLGRHITSPQFWQDCRLDVRSSLNKWEGTTGYIGWDTADGLISASLFFCLKYLPLSDVEQWFQSVIAIPDRYWKLQVVTWLVGAHRFLNGEIDHPSEFSLDNAHRIDWEWSHILDGNYYADKSDCLSHQVPFLPEENRDIVLLIARDISTTGLLDGFDDDQNGPTIIAEAAAVPGRFLELYQAVSAVG